MQKSFIVTLQEKKKKDKLKALKKAEREAKRAEGHAVEDSSDESSSDEDEFAEGGIVVFLAW